MRRGRGVVDAGCEDVFIGLCHSKHTQATWGALKDLRQGLNMADMHFFFCFFLSHVLLNLSPDGTIPCVEMSGRQGGEGSEESET